MATCSVTPLYHTTLWIRRDKRVSSAGLEKVGQRCKNCMNFFLWLYQIRSCLHRWYFSYIKLHSSVGSIILSHRKKCNDYKDGKLQLNLWSTVIQHNTNDWEHTTRQDSLGNGEGKRRRYFLWKNLASIKQKCIETSEIMTHTMDLRYTSNLYESTWGW